MKKVIHLANTRGHANHGWLDSFHTFSFSRYFNPERVQFGLLRVLNDDIVSPGMGFGTHPHDNMEIISIPLKGDLAHKDSTGRQEVIRKDDVQIMSAGSGLTHSEFNHSKTSEVNFLQLWIYPKERDIKPRYEQKTFLPESRVNQIQTVVSPKGEDALWINQDAWISLGKFNKDFSISYNLHNSTNGLYVFVIEGDVSIQGENLSRRDGIGLWQVERIDFTAISATELLLIEVPMER
jgi:hypothetical protein